MNRKLLVPIVSGVVIIIAFIISTIFHSHQSHQQQLKEEKLHKQELAQLKNKCFVQLEQLKRAFESTPPSSSQLNLLLNRFQKIPNRCQELLPQLYQQVATIALQKGNRFNQGRERCLRQKGILEKGIETATTPESIKTLREEVLKFVEGECTQFIDPTPLLSKLNKYQQKLLGCREELVLLKRDIISAQSVDELLPLKGELKNLSKNCPMLTDGIERTAQILKRRQKILENRSLRTDLELKKCHQRLFLLKGQVIGATSLEVIKGLKREILTLSTKCPQVDISQLLELVAKREGELENQQLVEREKLASCKGELEIVKEGITTAQTFSEIESYLSQGRQTIKRCPTLLPFFKSILQLANRKKGMLKLVQKQEELHRCQLKIAGLRELVTVSNSIEELNRILLQLENLECSQLEKSVSLLMVQIKRRIARLEGEYRRCDKKYQELELRFQQAKGFFHSNRQEIARIKGKAMELRDSGKCRSSTVQELNNLILKCNNEL